MAGAECARIASAQYRKVSKAEEDDDKRADAAADAAVREANWAPVAEDSQTQLTSVAASGVKQAMAVLGIDDEGITEQTFEAAREWAKARAAELVGKKWVDGEFVDNPDAEMAITDTVREEMRAAVASAIDEGLSAADLADRIDSLASFSEERAMLIARTEILRAHNQAHLQTFRNSGVVTQKAWSTAGEDVCDECQENEDEGAIDLGDVFPSGDDAPPGHPLCRCVLTAHIEESEDDGEIDEEEDEASE